MRVQATLLAVGLLLATGSARAEDEGASADARCVAIATMLAGSTTATPEMRSTAPTMITYFIGRLKGRDPGVDVAKLVSAKFEEMAGGDRRAEELRCSDEMTALSQDEHHLADRLQASARRHAQAGKAKKKKAPAR
jgi:hypothetical protein